MNKKPLIWIIDYRIKDENPFALKLFFEHEKYPATIKEFISMDEARKAIGQPDFILIDFATLTDIPSIFSSVTGTLRLAVHHFEQLAELHPGAIYGLYSAVDSWAEDMVDEINEENEEYIVEFMKWGNPLPFLERFKE